MIPPLNDLGGGYSQCKINTAPAYTYIIPQNTNPVNSFDKFLPPKHFKKRPNFSQNVSYFHKLVSVLLPTVKRVVFFIFSFYIFFMAFFVSDVQKNKCFTRKKYRINYMRFFAIKNIFFRRVKIH